MSACVYRELSQKQLPNYAIRDEYTCTKGKTSVHINYISLIVQRTTRS